MEIGSEVYLAGVDSLAVPDELRTQILAVTKERLLALEQTATNRIGYFIALALPRRVVVGHSGGKDSCTIYTLMDKLLTRASIIHVVHNPKPSVSVGDKEVLYALSLQREITYVPSRDMTKYMMNPDYYGQVDGSRREEWNRGARSTDVIIDGQTINRKDMPVTTASGLCGKPTLYPIVDWTDAEVYAYLLHNEIHISKDYLK